MPVTTRFEVEVTTETRADAVRWMSAVMFKGKYGAGGIRTGKVHGRIPITPSGARFDELPEPPAKKSGEDP